MKIQRLKIRLLGIILVALGTSCTEQNAISYTDYVNVFIGTGGHGHTFSRSNVSSWNGSTEP